MQSLTQSMQLSCFPRCLSANRPAKISCKPAAVRTQQRAPSCSFGSAPGPSRSRRAGSLTLVRADAAPAGQITSTLVKTMTDKIGRALDTDNVKITDLQGDGRHVNIDVIAAAFDGKSAVERQRMVYKAIWAELQEAVHAVDAMTTKTPTEAGL